MEATNDQPPKMATLRRPLQIVKKRSGPLEEALDKLDKTEDSKHDGTKQTTSNTVTHKVLDNVRSTTGGRRRSTIKEKDKKRERWLLTRKTWKYMTDAGRKLIPEGAQNRKEDIPKVEAHFQQICASEMRFVLWRRKFSYPGATRNSKHRLKQISRHTSAQRQAQTQSTTEQETVNNTNQIIELLHSYLKLDESFKTTTLLGTKTIRPDQTTSPSAQRPRRDIKQTQSANVSIRGPGFLPASLNKDLEPIPSENEQLLSCLTNSALLGSLPIKPENITPTLLEDKALLKQIYNALKKQQLHRILSKHSSLGSKTKTNLSHAHSLSSLFHFGNFASGSDKDVNIVSSTVQSKTSKHFTNDRVDGGAIRRTRSPPSTLNLNAESNSTTVYNKCKVAERIEKQCNSCGTQTNFIQLSEIKRLAEEYKEHKREDLLNQTACTTPAATDDELETHHHYRRKSSVDNEDISQSVSDTIKRYLRMARKKSVHDTDQANRFKRVNYDRNLRNIRAKGEINPPGMDDGLNKAVQTLDAWALIALDFIRGNEHSGVLETAHIDWERTLNERIMKKLDYESKLKQNTNGQTQKQSLSSSSSLSAPTSPTSNDNSYGASHSHCSTMNTSPSNAPSGSSSSGILVTGSQFLVNLWHASTSSSATMSPISTTQGKHDNTSLIANFKNGRANMQKSKSSSNVGQFVSKKILKSRSKSQTRSCTSPYSKWAPSDNNQWTSSNGDCIQISDTSLQNLSNIEAKLLQRVAVEKINELNIGVSLSNHEGKTNKRRILPKKKAVTTSFFDIGKKEEQSGRYSVFGNSLECCVENDRKRYLNLRTGTERGSRSSLVSLLRGSGLGSGFSNKLNENVRSCESLPANASANEGTNSNRENSSVQISRSQCDMRRKSHEFDTGFEMNDISLGAVHEFSEKADAELQVPLFVLSCIKYLEEHGLQKIGLFRVSTSKKRVKQMREIFDKNITSIIEAETCPHDVATLFKEFLRDLPEPLLCNNLYKAFLKTQKIRNRRLQLEGISHLIKLLPPAHRDTLYVLLKFLAKVAANSDDVTNPDGSLQITGNKMDSNNLATVFAPNILRSTCKANDSSKDDGNNEKELMSDVINVVRIMIDHYEELFKVPADLIDIVYSHMLDECPENLFLLCEQRNIAESRNSAVIQEHKLPQNCIGDARRQSTPIGLNKDDSSNSGILSASLQITVPKIKSSKISGVLSHEANDLDEVFFQSSRSPSFSDTEKSEVAPTSGPRFCTETIINNSPAQKLQTDKRREYNLEKQLQSSKCGPKPTACITSIGGATLRSKTADFEKISSESSKSRNQSTPLSVDVIAPKPGMRQQLYKRQQLIPSAKRFISADKKQK